MTNDFDIEGFMRLKLVLAITGLGKSTLYAAVKDGTFPKPVLIGKRTVAWIRTEVIAWVKTRIEQSRNPSN